MLTIMHARLQHYANQELPDIQAGFRKGRGTIDQIANICWIIEQGNSIKNIYLCFIDFAKAFDCVDHNKLWKALKRSLTESHHTPNAELLNCCCSVALLHSFLNLESINCSIQGSNCCFLASTQVFQETGKMVWCSHLF